MPSGPHNTFLKNLLKCSIEHVNANAKWQEKDKETEWFQREIYVPTRLDEKLLPELIGLKYPLVFLSGTPGSGKTQFLKRFRELLIEKDFSSFQFNGAPRTVATFKKNDNILLIKHDATQVESEIDDAAETLGELLEEDWSDHNFEREEKKAFYVVGINQGVLQRLIDLEGFQRLRKSVRDRSDPRVLNVDLSSRSAVNPHDHQDAFVTYLLLTLTDSKHWEDRPAGIGSIETCHGCALVGDALCPILANIQWLRREPAWKRIHELFELNHYIAGNVTTFRDVLAILSKAICGYIDYYGGNSPCESIRSQAKRADFVSIMNLSRLLIYNSIFSDKDPYSEYLDCLELDKSEQKRHSFFGFCGSYFASEPEDLGAMAMLDPTRSDSDILRDQDDAIFAFPTGFLSSPDGGFEKAFFEAFKQEFENLEYAEADDESIKSGKWSKKEWLLFCLVRLGRRKHFLLGKDSCKRLSTYEHAESFSETILKLTDGLQKGFIRQLIGDLKMALTAFSGEPESGTLKVVHGSRDAEIKCVLAFDAPFKVFVPKSETPYVEYFPREIYFEISDKKDSTGLGQFPPLKIDLEVWECLRRAHNGYSASYLGIERAKSIESFLQGLRSVAWDFQNCRVEVTREDSEVTIRKETGEIVIQ